MLRTVGDQPTLWESLLPAEALVMPAELVAGRCAVGRRAVLRAVPASSSTPRWGGRRSRSRRICG